MKNKSLQNNNFKKSMSGGAFRNQKTTTGFTLVEALVYIVIFSAIFLALVESVFYTNKTYLAIRSTHALENSAVTSMERMSRDIRNAYSVVVASSTLGVHPGVLAIKTKDGSGITKDVEYYLDSANMLHVKENGVDMGKLTASTTPVSNLIFTYSTSTSLISATTSNSVAIKIDMSLQVFKNQATTTEQFWATYILRGSY